MTKTETFTFEPAATYCSLCHQVLDGPVVDLPIYKLGELDYIELAHLECENDFAASRRNRSRHCQFGKIRE